MLSWGLDWLSAVGDSNQRHYVVYQSIKYRKKRDGHWGWVAWNGNQQWEIWRQDTCKNHFYPAQPVAPIASSDKILSLTEGIYLSLSAILAIKIRRAVKDWKQITQIPPKGLPKRPQLRLCRTGNNRTEERFGIELSWQDKPVNIDWGQIQNRAIAWGKPLPRLCIWLTSLIPCILPMRLTPHCPSCVLLSYPSWPTYTMCSPILQCLSWWAWGLNRAKSPRKLIGFKACSRQLNWGSSDLQGVSMYIAEAHVDCQCLASDQSTPHSHQIAQWHCSILRNLWSQCCCHLCDPNSPTLVVLPLYHIVSTLQYFSTLFLSSNQYLDDVARTHRTL